MSLIRPSPYVVTVLMQSEYRMLLKPHGNILHPFCISLNYCNIVQGNDESDSLPLRVQVRD